MEKLSLLEPAVLKAARSSLATEHDESTISLAPETWRHVWTASHHPPGQDLSRKLGMVENCTRFTLQKHISFDTRLAALHCHFASWLNNDTQMNVTSRKPGLSGPPQCQNAPIINSLQVAFIIKRIQRVKVVIHRVQGGNHWPPKSQLPASTYNRS